MPENDPNAYLPPEMQQSPAEPAPEAETEEGSSIGQGVLNMFAGFATGFATGYTGKDLLTPFLAQQAKRSEKRKAQGKALADLNVAVAQGGEAAQEELARITEAGGIDINNASPETLQLLSQEMLQFADRRAAEAGDEETRLGVARTSFFAQRPAMLQAGIITSDYDPSGASMEELASLQGQLSLWETNETKRRGDLDRANANANDFWNTTSEAIFDLNADEAEAQIEVAVGPLVNFPEEQERKRKALRESWRIGNSRAKVVEATNALNAGKFGITPYNDLPADAQQVYDGFKDIQVQRATGLLALPPVMRDGLSDGFIKALTKISGAAEFSTGNGTQFVSDVGTLGTTYAADIATLNLRAANHQSVEQRLAAINNLTGLDITIDQLDPSSWAAQTGVLTVEDPVAQAAISEFYYDPTRPKEQQTQIAALTDYVNIGGDKGSLVVTEDEMQERAQMLGGVLNEFFGGFFSGDTRQAEITEPGDVQLPDELVLDINEKTGVPSYSLLPPKNVKISQEYREVLDRIGTPGELRGDRDRSVALKQQIDAQALTQEFNIALGEGFAFLRTGGELDVEEWMRVGPVLGDGEVVSPALLAADIEEIGDDPERLLLMVAERALQESTTRAGTARERGLVPDLEVLKGQIDQAAVQYLDMIEAERTHPVTVDTSDIPFLAGPGTAPPTFKERISTIRERPNREIVERITKASKFPTKITIGEESFELEELDDDTLAYYLALRTIRL